jgi:two-component system chemotaxis response regulator CheB
LNDLYKAVVIGTSTGGTDALNQVFGPLAPSFPLPIFVVQHLYPLQQKAGIVKFNENCRISIKEAEEKEKIKSGQVYLAPPNYHLLIEDNHTISFSVDAKVNFSRPSIDVLFESAIDVFGKQLVGILLTGANADGVKGLRKISEYGGLTIVQDPDTAVAPTMPLAALEEFNVDLILSPVKIGNFLAEITKLC